MPVTPMSSSRDEVLDSLPIVSNIAIVVLGLHL